MLTNRLVGKHWVSFYHAELDDNGRQQRHHAWSNGQLFNVLRATIAFGMGIDKPDVLCVIHYAMPTSFHQEKEAIIRELDGIEDQAMNTRNTTALPNYNLHCGIHFKQAQRSGSHLLLEPERIAKLWQRR